MCVFPDAALALRTIKIKFIGGGKYETKVDGNGSSNCCKRFTNALDLGKVL